MGLFWREHDEQILSSIWLLFLVDYVMKDKGLMTYVEVVALWAVLEINMVLKCFPIFMKVM